jgi:hypothetical protein
MNKLIRSSLFCAASNARWAFSRAARRRWSLPLVALVIVCLALVGCGRRGPGGAALPVAKSKAPAQVPPHRHPVNENVATAKAPHKLSVAGGPKIRFNRSKSVAKPAIEVINLKPEDLAKLANAKLDQDQWTALFGIYVELGSESHLANQPAMLGSYKVEKNILRFEPRFPFHPGVHLRAVFDASQLPGLSGPKNQLVAEIVIPKVESAATTVVAQVYPSTNKLPENQLKFYIHFSAAMSRGEAYEHLHLIDAAGKEVDRPFLTLDEELWDLPYQRFTLFFDPGRIKRGLKPREEFGPSLMEGKAYTLVIDQEWKDAQGNPLKEAHRKSFEVGPPDDQPPDPKTWKIQAAPAGSDDALTVIFPKPLDHALLERCLWVTGPDDKRLTGTVSVSTEETRWHFTPDRVWQAGGHQLVVDKTLEDLAGNSIGRPFEVDVLHPIQRKVDMEKVAIPFEVTKGSAK